MKKINKFSVLKIRMLGFKRFKELYEVDFDKLTYITGGNGQGKTTIADAIAYAFCGTPFWGEKNFERLQNNESKEMIVEVDFVDENGEFHTLTRRREGNNTTITLDKIQRRQLDMTSIFADKDIFLSVLNPLYFIEKIAEDGKELLQKLLPVIDDKIVMEHLSDSTKTLLQNEKLQEPEFYLKKKREELKTINEDLIFFEGQIDLLKKQRQEAIENVDKVVAKGELIMSRKKELEEKQFKEIDIDALKKKQTEIANNLSSKKKSELIRKQAEVQNRRYVSKVADEILKLKTEIESLSKKCKDIKYHATCIQVGDACPTCHTAVTKENYSDIIGNLKKQYNDACEKAQELIQSYNELKKLEEKSIAKFEEFRADDLKKIESELAALGDNDISEIGMIEDRIRLGNLTDEEFSELESLNKQVELFTQEVNNLCETDKIPEKIAEIEESVKTRENRKVEIMNLIHAVTEFAAKKAELTLKNLKMNRASIKLYDIVKTTGEIKDTFKFTYDGKDYRWISTSEKVKAGLEVSKMLSKLTGLVYPTYIDNAECITTGLDSMPGQIIAAFARNTPLTVSSPRAKQEQVEEAA